MAINKVMFGSDVLIDISDSTIDASTLPAGLVGYKADGTRIVGEYVPPEGGGSYEYTETEYEHRTVTGNNTANLTLAELKAEPSAIFIIASAQITASANYAITSVLISDATKKAVTLRQNNNKSWGIEYVSTPSMSYNNGTATINSGNDQYQFRGEYAVVIVYDAVNTIEDGDGIYY